MNNYGEMNKKIIIQNLKFRNCKLSKVEIVK